MGSIMIRTLSPAFRFVALILVTNCKKTYIKPRVCSECFFFFFFFCTCFGLPKYATGSQNFISKHLWPHVKSFKKKGKKRRVLKGLREASSRGWRLSKACPPDPIPLPVFEANPWEGGDGSC